MEFRFNLLFLALFFIGITHCQLEEMQEIFNPSTRKYCGSHLAQALSTICRGNYNTIHKKGQMFQKRAHWDSQYSADLPSKPFTKRSIAVSLVGNSHRRTKRYGHGVYNECCEKSCSHEELSSYCAAPYGKRR